MIDLSGALKKWNTDGFEAALKSELNGCDTSHFPLHKCTSHGGEIDADSISIIVIGCAENEDSVEATIGIYFTENVPNCCSGDEPMPNNGCCELLIKISKASGEARISVLPDQDA